MQHSDRTEAATIVGATVEEEGRYIYCIADAGERVSLGEIGIGGSRVYTIPQVDICAVVHDCPARPYQSDDQEVVKAWVVTHQRVVEAAWERWGTVLPLTFGIIIKGEAEASVEGNVKGWLQQEYEGLAKRLERVRGKAEYGVQIFWNPQVITKGIAASSPEIKQLEQEILSKPRGLAYMYRQRLAKLVQRNLETRADECFRDFYGRIRQRAEDVRVEKTKKAEGGLQMILNLSCLVQRERYTELGEELDRFNRMEGFSVRFTGPWPPYSFVGSA